MSAAAGSRAEVRAAVLVRVDGRLYEMFPDGRAGTRPQDSSGTFTNAPELASPPLDTVTLRDSVLACRPGMRGRDKGMPNYEKEIAVQDELIARRKKALARRRDKTGQKPGTLSERQLKKLIKQAQRRKAKLARDRDRRAGKKKGTEE